MIVIKKLKVLVEDDLCSFGFNGFETDKIYSVKKEERNKNLNIIITIESLKSTYRKIWSSSVASQEHFNTVLKEDFSFGAYEKGLLIGFVIVSKIDWNNTFWIENIRVSEMHQSKGVGKRLLEYLFKLAMEEKVRLVGLESQGANYTAIEFYKKNGFEIDGVDFSRYPKRLNEVQEVAIIMKRTI